jgi:tetratricopeptide (TPR) repeat protein
VVQVLELLLSGPPPAPVSFNFSGTRRHRGGGAGGGKGVGEIVLAHCPNRRVPGGLSAVVMKAMQGEPEDRYQSVEEMQEDISAWQGGFPTKAERASLIKQIRLFVERHKGAVVLFGVGFVLFNFLVFSFILQLGVEKRRAQASEKQARKSEEQAKRQKQLAEERLKELQGTAPTYYEEAKNLVEEQHMETALDRVDFAISKVPNEADYHLLRGNILQTLCLLDEASAAYENALRLKPGFEEALANLQLTNQLKDKVAKEGLSPSTLGELAEALRKQNRKEESDFLLGKTARKSERELNRGEIRRQGNVPSGANRMPLSAAWSYGVGGWDPAEARVQFKKLDAFESGLWLVGQEYPDPEAGFLYLSKEGGQTGSDKLHSPVRRWTSVDRGEFRVRGSFRVVGNEGAGVIVRVVSERRGRLAEWVVAPGGEQEIELNSVQLHSGESLDFIVECRVNSVSDAYLWEVEIQGEGVDWSSKRDFATKRGLEYLEALKVLRGRNRGIGGGPALSGAGAQVLPPADAKAARPEGRAQEVAPKP